MSLKLPRLKAYLRRSAAATLLACVAAAATITAQFAVFNEGHEGEIWELIHTLELPDSVAGSGDQVGNSNWASGITWVNGELFVADNYTSVINKFDQDLQPVALPDADWYGEPGTPTFGWAPNEATAADVSVDGGAAQKALIVTDFVESRIFAFRPNGEHIFTIAIPEKDGDPAYVPGLNGVALTVGARFELNHPAGGEPTLRVVGRLAVAWPEYFDLASGAALIYDNSEFTYEGDHYRFQANAPDAELSGDVAETGDSTIPAVKALTGVAFDSAGNFYMVDSWTGRLHGYDSNFEHRFAFGTPDATGETTEEFEEAYGMTLWPSATGDRLLITLPLKNQAVIYAPSPRTGAPGTIERLFALDGLGAIDGLPHSSAFDPARGRVAVSDSGDNSVKVFQTPMLAVYDLQLRDAAAQPAASVCGGENYTVSFSITVPQGRSAVQAVTPHLQINGVETTVVPAPGDPSYGTENVGPLQPRDVISYTYSFTAPNVALPQSLHFAASASGTTTSVGGVGNSAIVTDVLQKFAELPVIDCGSGNLAPTIEAVTPLAPQPSGWTQVQPLPSVAFTVTLNAADSDGTISRITYSASGTNPIPVTTVTDRSSVNLTLLQPGVTTITYRAFDDDLKPSAPGTLVVRLDNSLPSICLNIPEPNGKTPGGEWWWNNTVTIPVVLADSHDPSPDIVAPIPSNFINGSLVFSAQGAGQFSTLVAEDHAGHQRVQGSNTTLDVCGPGRPGRLVNIDRTAPTVSEDADETVVHPSLTVTISGADALSGVRYVEYSINGGPFARVQASSVPVPLNTSSTIAFRSIDWAGNTSATVTRRYVVDPMAPPNAAPACGAAYAVADLWPPSHKQVYVTVSGVTDPDNQAIKINFTSILQDEPTNAAGQGNTMQEGGIERNGARAWVRAERSGTPRVPGDGRVYLIGFTATDSMGASCSGTVRLDVPHDQRGTGAVLSPGRWNSITGLPVVP